MKANLWKRIRAIEERVRLRRESRGMRFLSCAGMSPEAHLRKMLAHFLREAGHTMPAGMSDEDVRRFWDELRAKLHGTKPWNQEERPL